MAAIDHPAFAETEMANVVGLGRHNPDPLSMLRQFEESEAVGDRTHALFERAEQLTNAYRNGMAFGRREGFRAGFKRGTDWGMFCGAFAAGLLAVILIVGFAVAAGRVLPLGF